MRCIFFLSLCLLSVFYRKAYAFTPTDCLQQLTKINEKKTVFTGRDNVYCAYLRKNTIQDATFNIKNTNIDDWEITIGQWDKKSLSIDTANIPAITKENDHYKLSTNVININAIVWVLKNGEEGEISDVKLEKTFVKRAGDECSAFESNTFIWRDISWDNTNEKYIGSNLINLNNTVYFDTLALLFKKKNDRGKNNYFNGEYRIVFKIKSDSAEWMVYTGVYDEATKEVNVCQEWYLADNYPDISVSSDTDVLLENPDPDSSCKNNIIWWQNIKNDQNSQRIWLEKLAINNCENDDDEDWDDEDWDDEDDE